jgi:hypothetical protein
MNASLAPDLAEPRRSLRALDPIPGTRFGLAMFDKNGTVVCVSLRSYDSSNEQVPRRRS